MGTDYRKNIKHLYGRPNITARDVISLGASAISSSPGALADAQGISTHPAPRAAKLEGATVVSSSGLSTGAIGVALKVNGATVASGTLGVGDTYLDLLLSQENLEQLSLDAGDNVRLLYVATGLGASPNLSGKVFESLLE